MRFKALVIALAMLAGSVIVSWQQAPRAAACSCALGSTAEFVEWADLVATASVRKVDMPVVRTSGEDEAVYTMDLTEVWEGAADPRIEVHSAADGAACGIEGIAEGNTIILFASHEDSVWRTNLCSGTGLHSDTLAGELTAALGSPTQIEPVPEPSGLPGGMTIPLLIIGASGLLAGAIGLRRQR
ncbi:MAG: hypothetical protein QM713_08225 [Arachnia sp.]